MYLMHAAVSSDCYEGIRAQCLPKGGKLGEPSSRKLITELEWCGKGEGLRTPQIPRTKPSTRLLGMLQVLEISRETLHQWVKRSVQTSVPVHVEPWPRGSYGVSRGSVK